MRGAICHDMKFVKILNYSNANADRTSEVIDTAGFGRCCVLVDFAAINDSVTETLRLTQSDIADDQNTLNSGANVAGSAQTVAGTADETIKFIDFAPTKRYYQLVLDKDATNPSAESAIAILYQPTGGKPVTQAAGSSTVGEGTAAVVGEYIGAAIAGDP